MSSKSTTSMKCLVCHVGARQRTQFIQPSHAVAATFALARRIQHIPTFHGRRLIHSGSMRQLLRLQHSETNDVGGSLIQIPRPSDCRRPISSTAPRRQQYEITLNSKSKPTPFQTLGVSPDDTFAAIKKAFLKIAMKNHPDMHAKDDETLTKEDQDRMRQKFIEARVAFESLEETPTGHAVVKGDNDKKQKEKEEEDAFNAWFQQETGHDMPFMDFKTMKEVADMTDDMSIGLDRDGGMWTLAKMVTAAVRQGNSNAAANILQLDAGETKAPKEGDIDGVLRRRRKPHRV